MLSSDRPVVEIKADLLDRARFAKALASALRSWSSNNSFVIGLHAPWGQGKTSVKNFVLEALGSHSNVWSVVDFNPWQWSSYGNLNDAFFDEAAVALGKQSRLRNKDLAVRWRFYAARLKGVATAAKFLGSPLRLGAAIVGFVSLCGVVWPSRILYLLIAILLLLLSLTRILVPFLEAMAEALHPKGKDTEVSLESIRHSLSALLERSSNKVLIVVDDLDRLSPKELSDMVQLVKANGDLPNLVYLLIGDREVIADHLAVHLHVDGQAYLEKIIQVSIDLPSVPSWRVQKVLFEGLNKLLGPQPICDLFEAVYWQEVFPNIGIYFRDLRSVSRFLSTLEFHMGMFLDTTAFDVNPIDIIAVETIRLFEPKLYRLVQKERAFLLGEELSKDNKEQIAQHLELICEAVPSERRNSINGLLRALFPMIRMASNGYVISSQTKAAWSRAFRIGSAKHFDKYFEISSDPRDLSTSDIRRFVGSSTRQEFQGALLALHDRQLLDKAVERLREYDSVLPLNLIPAALTALFDVGDKISNTYQGLYSASPLLQAEFLAASIYDRLPKQAALEDMKVALLVTEGLILPIHAVARILQKAEDGSLSFSLSIDNASELRAIMLAKITKAAETGELDHNRNLRPVLSFWKLWSGEDVALRAYTSKLTRTKQGVIAFLKGMMLTAYSSGWKILRCWNCTEELSTDGLLGKGTTALTLSMTKTIDIP